MCRPLRNRYCMRLWRGCRPDWPPARSAARRVLALDPDQGLADFRAEEHANPFVPAAPPAAGRRPRSLMPQREVHPRDRPGRSA